ncbi:MAG TPA: hypothetical protein VFQ40_08880 [Actinomycetota bacterium]|nr:hypothetical protein [Actinomycetota bacterium]
MAWVLLLLILLAAAFGVLGAVVKATAFIVLTILLTLAVLATIAWYGIKGQLRRFQQEIEREDRPRSAAGRGGRADGELPSRDDRY